MYNRPIQKELVALVIFPYLRNDSRVYLQALMSDVRHSILPSSDVWQTEMRFTTAREPQFCQLKPESQLKNHLKITPVLQLHR